MFKYKIMIVAPQGLSKLGQSVSEYFDTDIELELHAVPERIVTKDFKVVIFDAINAGDLDLSQVSTLVRMDEVVDIPVVVMAAISSLQEKIEALEVGCDDFIEADTVADEACARLTKSIYHRVATDQLSTRLELANQTAKTALVDNSDLGANIQFLLAVHGCDNLDILGQLFFSTIERYGLKCSLQMRSLTETKDMEATGMAKHLESQLLTQLKGSDRFIDFGPRTIINYHNVSLLVKNMPIEEPEKYGAIKDNTFSLVQGLSARVTALDDQKRLIEERESMKRLSHDSHTVMSTIQMAYQDVMKNIADEVDKANELISMKIPSLALTEEDERFLEGTMEHCVKNTMRIFNDGLKVDELMERLERSIERTLKAVEETQNKKEAQAQAQVMQNNASKESSVELF